MEWVAYALIGAPIWLAYTLLRTRAEGRHKSIQAEAVQAGLTEPNTLHPVFDTSRCVGCTACVQACPEGDVIGLIGGKAMLIDPTRCIGHGACQKACPVGAIDLVFGTARRGVDIPLVDADFQSDVNGIYLAGEIGGMGLIRNAITQGVEATEAIASSLAGERRAADADLLDLLIVGAGPAGIAASLAAKRAGLRFATVEQDSLGGTVAHYPRHKVVMTEPAVLPLYGEIKQRTISKEGLLGIWHEVVSATGLEIRCQERVTQIARAEGVFRITTSAQIIRARRVLLAIGRRGTPRRLGVPGEDLNKVVYRLVDPEQYRGAKVLVVGGGDSALEAAASLAEQHGVEVKLSYRSGSFSRARRLNRQRIEALVASGAMEVFFDSEVHSISSDEVSLTAHGELKRLPNDHIVVCAGGVLPSAFLMEIGIRIERHFGRDRAPNVILRAA